MFRKIVSGGQTGVDRAALDFALAHGIEHGGWCPKGRLAEDGTLDERYSLNETPRKEYNQRTEWNVRDSDGTLVIFILELTGGTLYTCEVARKLGKPVFTAESGGFGKEREVFDWLVNNNIEVLNIAGPRSSSEPGIYAMTLEFLGNIHACR
ncbi:putative molybdenum carrier protein [Prosthecochloris sp. SCSIO W1101]|uniref:putative molybdenum carrier protein n=1 Tax=Prosthecochloris sp. SCSIO W1101 TaxID=2992242 RepID=UPI00223E2B3B|nr:putative molybdenum carrier protein [Prosthecochloris sp. SCSIO W1101]UZJ40655.1 putative molybdenum carrier protein [Prosthecochloris sp. SCSIO W1101]